MTLSLNTEVLLPGATKKIPLQEALSSEEGAEFVHDACYEAEAAIADLSPYLIRELPQAEKITFCFVGKESSITPRNLKTNPLTLERLQTMLLRHHLCAYANYTNAYPVADLKAIKITNPDEEVEINYDSTAVPDDLAQMGYTADSVIQDSSDPNDNGLDEDDGGNDNGPRTLAKICSFDFSARAEWLAWIRRSQIPQDILDAGFTPDQQITLKDGDVSMVSMPVKTAFHSDGWREAALEQITNSPEYCLGVQRSEMQALLTWAQTQTGVQPRGRSVGEVAYDWLHLEGPEQPNTWALYKLLGHGDGTRRPAEIPEVGDAALSSVQGLSAAGKKLLSNRRFRIMYHALGDKYVLGNLDIPDYWGRGRADTLATLGQDPDALKRMGKAFHYLGNKPVTLKYFQPGAPTASNLSAQSPLALLSDPNDYAGKNTLKFLDEAVEHHRQTPLFVLGGAALTGGIVAWLYLDYLKEERGLQFWHLYRAMAEAWQHEKRLTAPMIEPILLKFGMLPAPDVVNAWLFFSDKMDTLGSIISAKVYRKLSSLDSTIGSVSINFKKLPQEFRPLFKKEVDVIFAAIKRGRKTK